MNLTPADLPVKSKPVICFGGDLKVLSKDPAPAQMNYQAKTQMICLISIW